MIEFVVEGTPRSHSANSRPRWQATVQQAAPAQDPLLDEPVRLRIDFFFETATDLDADNIIKPIQDALEDVVYEDDKAVVDVCARKVSRQDPRPIINAPAALSAALGSTSGNFVYIRVAAVGQEVTFS